MGILKSYVIARAIYNAYKHAFTMDIKGTIQWPHVINSTLDSEIMISEQSDWSVV